MFSGRTALFPSAGSSSILDRDTNNMSNKYKINTQVDVFHDIAEVIYQDNIEQLKAIRNDIKELARLNNDANFFYELEGSPKDWK